MRLELGQVLELLDALIVPLLLEANDTATAVTHAKDLACAVEGHRREQVVLGNRRRVGLAQLLQRHQVQRFYHLVERAAIACGRRALHQAFDC